MAFLAGRNYVVPRDVRNVFADVSRHRIVLSSKARVAHVTADTVLDMILKDISEPTIQKEQKEYHA